MKKKKKGDLKKSIDGTGLPSHKPVCLQPGTWNAIGLSRLPHHGMGLGMYHTGYGTAGRPLHLRDHTCLRKNSRKQDLEKLMGPSATPKPLGQSPCFPLAHRLMFFWPLFSLLPPMPHHALITMAFIYKLSLTTGPLAGTHFPAPSFVQFMLLTPQVWKGMPPPHKCIVRGSWY